jgi:hypothetical protein
MYSIKSLFIVTLTYISFLSNAQKLEKGTWLVGGNLTYLNVSQKVSSIGGYGGSYGSGSGAYGGGYGGGYGTANPATTYSTNIFIGSLSFAKMATKYFALGGKVSYLNSGGVDAAVIGPTSRFYVNYDKPSTFFLMGDLGFNTKGGSASYDFGIGLSNLLSEHISVDIIGTYGNSFTSNGTQSNSGSDISIYALQVGLQILLPQRK